MQMSKTLWFLLVWILEQMYPQNCFLLPDHILCIHVFLYFLCLLHLHWIYFWIFTWYQQHSYFLVLGEVSRSNFSQLDQALLSCILSILHICWLLKNSWVPLGTLMLSLTHMLISFLFQLHIFYYQWFGFQGDFYVFFLMVSSCLVLVVLPLPSLLILIIFYLLQFVILPLVFLQSHLHHHYLVFVGYLEIWLL